MSKKVERLKKKDIDSYSKFIYEIFGYEINKEAIEKAMQDYTILVIKVDNEVVASATLEERFEHVKNKKYYYVTYLGVLKEYRREGYASKIFESIEELAKKNDISYLELTSGNQRRSAHFFYKSKEFKIKDTTVFVKIY